ncbi:MAG: HpcH/HpaI aldolase family protein [Gemmobacter sp.]
MAGVGTAEGGARAIGRLNGVIGALEAGKPAFMAFARPARHEAAALGSSDLDGVLFEMEHTPFSAGDLRDALAYLVDRRRLVERGTLAPPVTPFARIPANGVEMNLWQAKQVLDMGVYGVVWPHVATPAQAENAVAACRYGRPLAASGHPIGRRGDGPAIAARYWGLGQQEYYARADVWPLNPAGEILVMLMIESVEAIDALPEILRVPGVGAIMIGEGDLSQQLGHPRAYDHPAVRREVARVLAAAAQAGVPVAHPHVGPDNAEQVLAAGFRILCTTPTRSFAGLDRGRALARRDGG